MKWDSLSGKIGAHSCDLSGLLIVSTTSLKVEKQLKASGTFVYILGQTVKQLCPKAGIQGHFTNHSLRATAATRICESKVNEQLIMW